MDRNVCGLDRALRVVAGIALLVVALRPNPAHRPGTVTPRRVLAGYGAAELLLINGTLQWCPLNAAFGINTCVADWPVLIRRALRGSSGPEEAAREWAEVPIE
jgi:hypothetical protein